MSGALLGILAFLLVAGSMVLWARRIRNVEIPKDRRAFVACWVGRAVLGIPGLPVPTTILADAEGVVRWIDRSENYQRRSDPDYVLSALREHIA